MKLSLLVICTAATGSLASLAPGAGSHDIARVRRHHDPVKRAKCKARQLAKASNGTAIASSTKSSSAANSTSTSTTSAAFTRNALGLASNALQNNGMFIGMLPDNGDSGGSLEMPSSMKAAIGKVPAVIDLYAHIRGDRTDVPFTGAELDDIGGSETTGYSGLFNSGVKKASEIKGYKAGALRTDTIKACKQGAVLAVSAMPLYGYQGLNKQSNAQAVRLAKVLANYTDAGCPVWLRYGHEFNYYIDSSSASEDTINGQKIYAGSASDWVESWTTVAQTMRKLAPKVKMWWCANIASVDAIRPFFPSDTSTIDLVGIDFYPSDANVDLVGSLKGFHDAFASKSRAFMIGETGLTSSQADKQALVKNWTAKSILSQMEHYIGLNVFNYDKGACFMMIQGCSDSAAGKKFFATLK